MLDALLDPKSIDVYDQYGSEELRQEKASTDGVAPPPDAIEPDPDLTPVEAEEARKRYLLTHFWISARGYWGRGGEWLASPCSIGLLALIVTNVGFQYGINIWNRA